MMFAAFCSSHGRHGASYGERHVTERFVESKALATMNEMLDLLVYPWASLPQDTVFCDVGGNNGHVSISLLKAFPQLKIVVQDLPAVVNQGHEVCSIHHSGQRD